MKVKSIESKDMRILNGLSPMIVGQYELAKTQIVPLQDHQILKTHDCESAVECKDSHPVLVQNAPRSHQEDPVTFCDRKQEAQEGECITRSKIHTLHRFFTCLLQQLMLSQC